MPSILSVCLAGALAAFAPGVLTQTTAPNYALCTILGCNVPPSVTSTVTSTITDTATVTAPCPTKPTLFPFPCNPGAWIIQRNKLTYLDVPSGQEGVVIADLRPSSGEINAMGYHPFENLIYAIQGNELLRIGLDGNFDVVLNLPNPTAPYNLGEFDLDGQFWFGRHGLSWYRVDLFPGSPTYGQLVGSGTMTLPEVLEVADWAYTPSSTGYLYAVGVRNNGEMTLIRWSTSTHQWQTVTATYGSLAVIPDTFGAMVATSDGILYGLDNKSGRVFRFSVLNTNAASLLGPGTASSRNDGARCFLRPSVP